MAFDTATRAKLQAFVNAARKLLTDEFQSQLQQTFGIQPTGEMAAIKDLKNINDDERGIAQKLHERIEHLVAGLEGDKHARKTAVARVIREQAFTVLNRFVAIRLAEERDIIAKSCNEGFQSKSFRVYEQVAGTTIGNQYERYKTFMYCLYDELALDLGVLFDRYSPYGMLFPRQTALTALFELINNKDLASIYTEDETIGWVYQYYNDPAERKKMRDESAAPRNSRELAVRNQFFTPRYVVEFLTDNTLGRIWYEMTQGETGLKEVCRYLVRRPNEIFLKPGDVAPAQPQTDNLSQEELLKQPVYIVHRPLKDPRTILLLDPACGSMHFGLYAFDLFEIIYAEAWELESTLGPDVFSRDAGMLPLHQSFADKEAYLKEVPRLIIEYNLHGIDIDPRCAQIAGLSLWLRAQKAWQKLGLKALERPAIKRSNIVCAEPMPGEKDLLHDFVAREFPKDEQVIFKHLLETIFDKMQLAGEAGSLLKIEEEITDAVEAARFRWLKMQEQFQFADSLTLTGDFWVSAEERLLKALRDYAEHAEGSGGFQRRLFAEDAAQGFAFIDVSRKRFDVVVMNPPFGEATIASEKMLKGYPKGTPTNLYTVFLVRASQWSNANGSFAAISDSTFLKQPSFLATRHLLLSREAPLYALIDLGWGVLDANVRTAAVVVIKGNKDDFYALDIAEAADREKTLFAATSNALFAIKSHSQVTALPKSVFALNVTKTAGRQLSNMSSLGTLSTLPWGCGANDAFRLFRLRWEVHSDRIGTAWSFLTNGGTFSPFYRENFLLCRREMENGESAFTMEFREGKDKLYDASGQELYWRPGLTYPKRSEFFHVSILPEAHIFTPEGKGLFLSDSNSIWLHLGILNSTFVASIAGIICGPHKQRGDVELIKVPTVTGATAEFVAKGAQTIFEIGRSLMQSEEDSVWFLYPRVNNEGLNAFSSLSLLLATQNAAHSAALAKVLSIMHEIDLQISSAIPEELREFCENVGLEKQRKMLWSELSLNGVALFSFLFGCSVGRWDIRYPAGERLPPELPDPFAPSPVCPPGMLQNKQGLPAGPKEIPANYPVDIPWDGILVDDANHKLDVLARIRQVIEIIWKDRVEAIEQEACEILGTTDLREYFAKPGNFFADHLKRYSKSRRQAPIYWPLSTRSGEYTIWVYYHRLNDQTLHKILLDFVNPKIDETENVLSRFSKKAAKDLSADERKENEQLKDLLEELRDFKTEIERLIALPYRPNLNDGVEITAAPLYKLFRLPKWQNRLREAWGNLESGEYDWAHLAYAIWPERVKTKCKKDKSLAIAHGLEDLYVEPTPKAGKKKANKKAVEQPTLAGFDEDR